jgi:hypothetical protein
MMNLVSMVGMTAAGVSDLIRAIGAFAWPAAAVAGVVILRGPLGTLLENIRSAKWRNLEVLFGARQALRQVETALEVESPLREPLTAARVDLDDEITARLALFDSKTGEYLGGKSPAARRFAADILASEIVDARRRADQLLEEADRGVTPEPPGPAGPPSGPR